MATVEQCGYIGRTHDPCTNPVEGYLVPGNKEVELHPICNECAPVAMHLEYGSRSYISKLHVDKLWCFICMGEPLMRDDPVARARWHQVGHPVAGPAYPEGA